MNYMFLGRMIPPHMQEKVARRSAYNMQDAANALQWHLYNGLSRNLACPLHLINLLPIGSFPQYYKWPFVKAETFATDHGDNNLSVGFCNVKLIRNRFQKKNIKKALLRWCGQDAENRFVFIYTLCPAFMSAVAAAKERYPDLKVCAIVADLPNMSSLSSNQGMWLKKFQKRCSDESYAKLNAVDAFVLLTKPMADYMKITQPFCVVEGIATEPTEPVSFLPQTDGPITILYTGTLHKRFGIMHLVNAFRLMQGEQYELVLCGIGDAEAEIKQAAVEDARIKFLGQMPRAEVLALQRRATVLVNPRQNNEEFTKYSFPSKNLEYLSSGRPLVAYMLDGIPDEYDAYIYCVKDNSPEALAAKLTEVCEQPAAVTAAHAEQAYEFVQTHKNEVAQTKIILDMLRTCGLMSVDARDQGE